MKAITLLCVTLLCVIFASTAAARLTPKQFAQSWGGWWNHEAQIHKAVWRITAISCKADGEAVYLCVARLSNTKTGINACEDMGVGNDGTLLEAQKITCLPTA